VGIDGTGIKPPPATWSDYHPDANNFSIDLEELEDHEDAEGAED
jgi:hypothetical protein